MKYTKQLAIFLIFTSLWYLFLLFPTRNNSKSDFNYVFYPTEKTIKIKNGGTNKSLILVHGHGLSSDTFITWMDSSLYGNYYNNVVAINYYWYDGSKPENFIGNDTLTVNSNISDIIDVLFLYLNSSNFTDIDFLCHSMGGIVVRGLVCSYFNNLTDRGIYIDDIITMGTPNQGSLAFAYLGGNHPHQTMIDWLVFVRTYYFTENFDEAIWTVLFHQRILPMTTQLNQISKDHPFMDTLQVAGDETPYDQNITWTTIAARSYINLIFYINHFQKEISLFEYDEWEREKNALFINLLYQIVFWADLGDDIVVSVRNAWLKGANNIIWNFATHITFLYPNTAQRNSIINILID